MAHKSSAERHPRQGKSHMSSPWLLVIFVLTVALLVCVFHLLNRRVDQAWFFFTSSSPGILAVNWQDIQEVNKEEPQSDKGLFVFSAVVDYENLANDQVDVIVTTLDSLSKPLMCCIRTSNLKVVSISAQIHYSNKVVISDASIPNELSRGSYTALQYKCTLTTSDDYITYVTLAFKQCPEGEDRFTFVHYPIQNSEELAVCGKIDETTPPTASQLSLWLDTQKNLGVDRVVLYDLAGSEELSPVFERYRKIGFLDIQRYQLSDLTADDSDSDAMEYMQKATIPVLDCRQRLAGYKYILGIDVDMMLYPVEATSLIELFEEELLKHPEAAGFSIDVDWSPENPLSNEASRSRWLKGRTSWESTAFLYLPSRVATPSLRSLSPKPEHTILKLGRDKAILRHCPSAEWITCFPEARDNVPQ